MSRPVRAEGESDRHYLDRLLAYTIQVERDAEAEVSALKRTIRCMEEFDEAVGRLYQIYLPAEEGLIEMLEHIYSGEIISRAESIEAERYAPEGLTESEKAILIGADAMCQAIRDRLIERGCKAKRSPEDADAEGPR